MANNPKKPWVAFILSILLAGAGLAYLGKWGWAVLNLFVAFGIGVAIALTYPDISGPVGIGVCVASGVLAKTMAYEHNKKFAAPQETGMQAPPPVITVNADSFSS